MTILVTGATGFLGVNLVRHLVAAGHRVVGLDTAPASVAAEPIGALSDVTVLAGDVQRPGDLDSVLSRHQVTRVIHLGALTPTKDAQPSLAREAVLVNIAGTQNVLDACVQHGVSRCVLASSSAVYGDAVFGPAPVGEDTPAVPTTLYGLTKIAAEELGALAASRHGLNVVVARVTALFGSWERPTTSRSLMSPLWQVLRLAQDGQPVVISTRGHRDWTFAEDAAAALAVLATADDVRHQVYNIGCGVTWSPALLAEAIKNLRPSFQFQVDDHTTTLVYGDDLTRVRQPLDSRRVREEFGCTFHEPVEACRRYLRWWETVGLTASGAIPHTSIPGSQPINREQKP